MRFGPSKVCAQSGEPCLRFVTGASCAHAREALADKGKSQIVAGRHAKATRDQHRPWRGAGPKLTIVIHSRSVIFQVAEVAVPRELFTRTLERIQWFGVPPPLEQRG